MVSKTKMTSSRRRTKSVRFAPEERLCEYQRGPKKLTLDMCDEVWFQPEDFQNFRLDARDSSLNAIKKGLSAYIKRTYGHTDKQTQDMHNLWARCSDTRRGLERFINQEYGKNRRFTQKKTIQAVLYAQERLRKDGERDYGHTSAVISSVASAVSAEAVAFAAMLGRADYAAVVRRRVTVVRRVPSVRRKSAPNGRPLTRPTIETLKKRIAEQPEDDSSEHSDTIPVMGQSPEQKREKKEKRDQRNLLKQANLGRREITFLPR
jgi:hypothetical protein